MALYQNSNAQFVSFRNLANTDTGPSSSLCNFQTRVSSGSSGGTYTLRYSLNSDMTSSIVGGSGSSPLGATWVNRNAFLSGLQANTTYYWQVTGVVGTTTALSSIASFTTSPPNLPTVVVNTANTSIESASINYTLNAGGGATTSVLKYGTNPNTLNLSTVGFNASGNANTTNTINVLNLTGGTTYYLQVEATNSAGTTTSILYNFTTQPGLPPVLVQTNTNSVATTFASIEFTGNASGVTTSSVVNYGLSDSNLNLSQAGFSFTTSSHTSPILLTNLTLNTTYYYQVTLTNNYGSVSSEIFNFTTLAAPPQFLIANYPFNNSLNNSQGNTPFTAASTLLTSDRFGNPNAAVNTSGLSAASVNYLPVGNSARSVSLWFKRSESNVNIFRYGNQVFGCFINASNQYVLQGAGVDTNFMGSNPTNTWTHLVITYNGTQAKMYINGTQLGTAVTINLNTVNAGGFIIGQTSQTNSYDDINIYDFELNQTEITNLFTSNALSTDDFSQKDLEVALYPNPARDILNIKTELDLKSIEIYNIQGQKVLESNQKQINVSNLASGIYMVKLQDVENNTATKKIIIK